MSVNYRVLPRKPEHKPVSFSEYQKKNTEGIHPGCGCAVFVAILFVFPIPFMMLEEYLVRSGYYSVMEHGGYIIAPGILAGMAVATIVTYTLNSSFKKRNIERGELNTTRKANAEEDRRLRSEAYSLTSTLTRNYENSAQLAIELQEYLKEATAYLETAEKEYEENAFAPFWDAVEEAAKRLGDFNDKAKEIAKNAEQYNQKLAGEQHTFPAFPIRLEEIPDVAPVIERLRRVVRKGQTNFQFANIWEHRRTREVMIAGFRTLNDAIYNLGDTIERSVSNLQQSISSDIARLVEEQIKTREAIEETRESLEKRKEE